VSVQLCDRCGDVTVDDDPCRCRTPFDLVQVHRRHRTAVAAARRTDAMRPAAAQQPTGEPGQAA
jgi:hypothetical protein